MDQLQRSIYTLRFQLDFLSKRGTEFEDWFVRLAGYAFGADFESIRAYGSQGDRKCDGRRLSDRIIFQCYAPHGMSDVRLISKIKADFHGARQHWGQWMKAWVLVHNDGRGLPPRAGQFLDRLRLAHPEIKIETWSEPQLLDLALGLDQSGLHALFGPAPSIAIVDRMVMNDLVPVIDALARQNAVQRDPPLTPPTVEKLSHNGLSDDCAMLIRIGRRKSGLVETYLWRLPRPDLGERIADAFRTRYAELKTLGLSADDIFKHLQDYAGMNGAPARQGAALAVLAYFFDCCDIFDDPAVEGDDRP